MAGAIIAAGGALLTDFYELTMLQAHWRGGMRRRAVFEFFVRQLPAQRNFLLAAGLAQLLAYLAALRFTAAELAWLRGDGRFGPAFVATLADWRFDGDALPEGTVCSTTAPARCGNWRRFQPRGGCPHMTTKLPILTLSAGVVAFKLDGIISNLKYMCSKCTCRRFTRML